MQANEPNSRRGPDGTRPSSPESIWGAQGEARADRELQAPHVRGDPREAWGARSRAKRLLNFQVSKPQAPLEPGSTTGVHQPRARLESRFRWAKSTKNTCLCQAYSYPQPNVAITFGARSGGVGREHRDRVEWGVLAHVLARAGLVSPLLQTLENSRTVFRYDL
jgi:hypothetical protein